MRVRRATAEDAAELAQLRYAFRTEEAPAAEERDAFVPRAAAWFRTALASAHWLGWVAEADGRLVGHVFLQLVDKVPKPTGGPERLGYLTNSYVLPEYRGAGLGGRLIEALTAYAREQELDAVIVWPSERSVPLYRRSGFGEPEDMLMLSLVDE